MKLTPILDRILVELDPFEQTFGDSTLVRPDIAMDKPRWGTVRGCGAGAIGKRGQRKPTSVHPGQRVYVPWATGHDLVIGGRLHLAVREADILAVEE